ncbi:unnamed protein product [Caenorhabditis bovis]|uniref:NR LBD domain-containing protein n=1 Tax=Caenorhabditis bovis TaxID=2654633 RepID=A0A8S1EAX7_9PELO|nr:unnamed protein product [Caenorhabditis bovis]
MDGLSSDSIEIFRKLRNAVFSETIFYLTKIKNDPEPCLRLGKLILMLSHLHKAFVKYQQELELCGFLELFESELDGEMYTVLHEALSL